MPASDSPKFSLNALDLKKLGREFLLLLGPTILMELGKLEGFRYVIHGTDYTLFVLIGLRIIAGIIQKTVTSSPQNPTS